MLQKYVPIDKLAEVRRVLYGHNGGGLVPQLQLEEQLYEAAARERLDLQVRLCCAVGGLAPWGFQKSGQTCCA